MIEAQAVALEALVQCPFAGVAEGWMADIVDQRERFGEIDVEAQRAGDLPRDLCNFDGVREAAAKVVGGAAGENLRLAREAAKRTRLHHAIAVTFERFAVVTGGCREGAIR